MGDSDDLLAESRKPRTWLALRSGREDSDISMAAGEFVAVYEDQKEERRLAALLFLFGHVYIGVYVYVLFNMSLNITTLT